MLPDLGLLIARLLLSLVFIVSGFEKALHWSAGLAEVAGRGLPLPSVALAVTVIVQILGGLAVAFGIGTRIGAVALAAFTLLATVIFHNFWSLADAVEYQRQFTLFLEHLAIVGGFVAIATVGPGRLTLRGGFGARTERAHA